MTLSPSTKTVAEPEATIAAPRHLGDIGERFGLVALVVVVWLLFAVLPESSAAFTSAANVQAILANTPVVSIIAIAAIFPLICGHFDFSVGATAVASSVVCAAVQSQGAPLVLAIVAAVVAGGLVGLVNAVLVARFHLNAFVVTIGMATLIPGLVQWYTGGVDITSGIDQSLRDFGSLQWLGVPRGIWLLVVVAGVCWFVLSQTPLGRRLYAVGINPSAARLVGIRVDRTVFISFLASGTLAGLAGVILTARNGGGLVGSGTDLLFPALTAVFLGATAITPGRYNVLGVIIGVVFVAVSVSGLRLSGAADWVPAVFNGAALIIAVALSTFLSRRSKTE
ncbi:ABC transporter permease [Herbiconiux ginsengi]|uniref:Monosaccharide ABC transporter membrane protein, CUT2 family n=1 Tax=Herbiconiux ginsengi TaxID=381665 RepID=A0A1H3TUX2_9MICO|nr:ABC transporter permease [Herbiconiux ginsengi]SDZ53877.1 monosaccharide ABC transporter membrane protein, CUT2 family [Herbiconiux ginsengi]